MFRHCRGLSSRLCVVLLALVSLQTIHAEPAPTILVFGDSISAAYGIRVEEGWVSLLQRRLTQQGYGYRVVNASVSGETTGGALARLPRALDLHRPAILILELGGNDGLRGLPLDEVRTNLDSMIRKSRAAGARVMLAGMRMPPNYGRAYTEKFQAMYSDLSRQHQLPLIPFVLEDVALDESLMQADGLHPNAKAQAVLLDQIWPRLKPLLERSQRCRSCATGDISSEPHTASCNALRTTKNSSGAARGKVLAQALPARRPRGDRPEPLLLAQASFRGEFPEVS